MGGGTSRTRREPPAFRDARELPALVSYLRRRRCVLFVGAGLSRPAGYPGWAELMTTIVDETARHARASAHGGELRRLLADGRFTDVADQCRELLGRTAFSKILRAQLARPVEPPSATHRAIVQTPYACIVTTNFDTLLEDAYAKWSPDGVPKAPTGAQLAQQGTLLFDGAFFILKAHGTIHDDASMVFTTEDYRRITHANPAFNAMMAALLLTNAILFVGYSLSDPNFRLLLDSQLSTFGAETPPRYALMEDVSASQREILRRTSGIEALSFPKGAYGEVAGLLQYLARAGTARSAATMAPPAHGRRRALRARPSEPALALTLRARDTFVDLEFFETTTADLEGADVPLERKFSQTAPTLDWLKLQGVISPSVDNCRPSEHIAQLGSLLLKAAGAAETELSKLPPGRLVTLDLSPELAAVPWELMSVEGQPLAMRAPVCRRVTGFSDGSRGRPLVGTPLRILLIGDTEADSAEPAPLPGARAEVQQIARLVRRADPRHHVTVLIGRQASYARVLGEIAGGDYDVVHFAGHAWPERHETLVHLHDGKVSGSELVTLLIGHPPALLFLNSHYTGFVPVFSRPFALEMPVGASFDDFYRMVRRRRIGLEWAAARAGVGTFVGCVGTPSDQGAAGLAIDFYAAAMQGEPLATALWRARRAVSPGLDSTGLFFVMSGYGDTRLVSTEGARRERR